MRELFALLYSLPMCAPFRLWRSRLLFEKYYKWLWFKNTSGAWEEELRLNSFESIFESTVQIILMTFSSWTRWSRFSLQSSSRIPSDRMVKIKQPGWSERERCAGSFEYKEEGAGRITSGGLVMWRTAQNWEEWSTEMGNEESGVLHAGLFWLMLVD